MGFKEKKPAPRPIKSSTPNDSFVRVS